MVATRRTWLPALAMAIALLGSSGAVSTASANKYQGKVYNTVCNSNAQKATARIKEHGTSGTTWMRITADFQRYTNGSWRTTRSAYRQSARQFVDDQTDHTLTWTKSFGYHGADYSHPTRISFLFEWNNDTATLHVLGRNSATCS